ncbi:hypothetical protein WJX81_003697 [Elliptochloris bilobata]|uniref:Uncharacterized protein n=1 Tax=Elliptochloris bilobata TaxID=381761 RepID=A0AAW1R3A1_9CHLO
MRNTQNVKVANGVHLDALEDLGANPNLFKDLFDMDGFADCDKMYKLADVTTGGIRLADVNALNKEFGIAYNVSKAGSHRPPHNHVNSGRQAHSAAC